MKLMVDFFIVTLKVLILSDVKVTYVISESTILFKYSGSLCQVAIDIQSDSHQRAGVSRTHVIHPATLINDKYVITRTHSHGTCTCCRHVWCTLLIDALNLCGKYNILVQIICQSKAKTVIVHITIRTQKYFLYKPWRPNFFSNLLSSKFLVSSFWFIWKPMLWVYGHYKYFTLSVRDSTWDVRFWRLKSFPVWGRK